MHDLEAENLQRRRMPLWHTRVERLAPIHNTHRSYHRPDIGQHLAYKFADLKAAQPWACIILYSGPPIFRATHGCQGWAVEPC